jgi:predicted GIY-YIG superfamily endonuclease
MPRERIPLGDDLLATTLHAHHLPPRRGRDTAHGLWAVYTVYESLQRIEVPLYVGVTKNVHERLHQHRRDKVWWPLAGEITVHGYFDNRSDAYEAEEQQVHALQPLLNVVANQHSDRTMPDG